MVYKITAFSWGDRECAINKGSRENFKKNPIQKKKSGKVYALKKAFPRGKCKLGSRKTHQ